MDAPVTTKAALLQVLISGPGFGLDLIDRARTRTGGAVRLNQGSVYPALRSLESSGLIESYEEADPTGIRGGRPRRYYRITAKGHRAATAQSQAIMALVQFQVVRP
ncbi:MAG: helix-turn-helix transcriptional regulator [Anaeromyxobacter sp.]|nr:helix-turn-helix transcriptional regulator [Anaeromyxobacter sp.]